MRHSKKGKSKSTSRTKLAMTPESSEAPTLLMVLLEEWGLRPIDLKEINVVGTAPMQNVAHHREERAIVSRAQIQLRIGRSGIVRLSTFRQFFIN